MRQKRQLNERDVCDLLHIDLSTLFLWIIRKRLPLPTSRRRNTSYWMRSDVERWMQEHKKT